MREAAPNFPMPRHLISVPRQCSLLSLLSVLIFSSVVSAQSGNNEKDTGKGKSALPTLSWDENRPGSTFAAGVDGKYRYGLWSGDVGVVLAVDAREVQIVAHRIEPILGVLLTVRYRGDRSLEVAPEKISLQFMKHFKVVEIALDPGDYTQKIQADADLIDDNFKHRIAQNPEKKQALETRLQNYQKSVSELIEFVGQKSLQPAHLDRGNPEANGWVFFNTDTKWIGRLKAQEEFVLRVPLDGKIFQFPFKVPPKTGELLLRKRD